MVSPTLMLSSSISPAQESSAVVGQQLLMTDGHSAGTRELTSQKCSDNAWVEPPSQSPNITLELAGKASEDAEKKKGID